jgi:hypothetical protein
MIQNLKVDEAINFLEVIVDLVGCRYWKDETTRLNEYEPIRLWLVQVRWMFHRHLHKRVLRMVEGIYGMMKNVRGRDVVRLRRRRVVMIKQRKVLTVVQVLQ